MNYKKMSVTLKIVKSERRFNYRRLKEIEQIHCCKNMKLNGGFSFFVIWTESGCRWVHGTLFDF